MNRSRNRSLKPSCAGVVLPLKRCARCCPAWKMYLSNSLTSGSARWRPPMHSPFRGFLAIFYKEVLHMRRDSMAILFALVVPIFEMVILGAAIDTNVRQVPTVIYDQSGVMESMGSTVGTGDTRALIDRFRNSDTFR